MKLLKRTAPYSQEQIAEQIAQVSKCMQLRDKAQGDEAIARAVTAVECAQEILNYMLQEVVESSHNRK